MLWEMMLYRGDSTKIAQFDVAKTSDRGLFGPGIYLTSDPEVAADYTVKQGDPHILYSDPEAKTQRELMAGYIRVIIDQVIDWPTKQNELKQDWAMTALPGHKRGADVNGMKDSGWRSLGRFLAEHHKALAIAHYSAAQAKLKALLPNLKIARNTQGELSIIARDHQATIAGFDIPDSYLNRVLHTERPLPDKVLAFIRTLWFAELGPTGHDLRDGDENGVDFDAYVKNYKTRGTRYAWTDRMIGGKGENPTFDELRNGTNGGYHVFVDGLFDKAGRHKRFVKGLQALGYVGLAYEGGLRAGGYTRGGGGRLHQAFVFWNTSELAAFRVSDQSPTNAIAHEPKSIQRHKFDKIYKSPGGY
jgi:hypothetical protein